MAALDPSERKALADFASGPKLVQPPAPQLSIGDYLRMISQIPPSLSPPKPVRFKGKQWKL